MDAKRPRAANDGAKAWVDPEGYVRYLAKSKEAFEALVAKEAPAAQ
jgi:hypothetical protein